METLAAEGLSELDVLALTLHHEANSEGPIGMVAVGCVIRNRADWGPWGRSMREVCLAPKQFSCWSPAGGKKNHGRLLINADSILAGKRPTTMTRAYEVAYAILGEQPDITLGSDHYYAPKAMDPPGTVPTWAKNKTPRTVLGNHIFFRFRPEDDVPRGTVTT